MNELSQFLVGHAEPVLFLAIFAEQLGVPIPAAPILLAAGTLAADGIINPVSALATIIAACLLADLLWFYVGRRGGDGLAQFLNRLPLGHTSRFARTEGLFQRYGMSAVAGAKFIPGIGFLMPALAGALGVKLGKFLKFDLLGSSLYGIFYLELGLLFSQQLTSLLHWLNHFGVVMMVLVLVALLLLFALGKWAQRRKTPAPSQATTSQILTPLLRG